jgi:DNA end-binding protein Ku
MKKAYWQGTLSCDLLTMPIKLYAVVTTPGPRFHYLHVQCRTPLEYIRHCPHCGTAVAGEDIVRGYEYEDSLVVVSEHELASLSQTTKQDRVLTLRQCVHSHAIDPLCFDRAFYVEPGPGAKRAYALLLEVLRRAGMVALGTATLRNHEQRIALRPAAGVLALHTLVAPDAMLAPEQLSLPQRPPNPAEINAAQDWITRLSGVYAPEHWVDRSQVALSALLARKAKTSANRVPALAVRARWQSSSPPPQAAA